MKTAKEARIEILKRYEESPRNWHVLTGRDPRGYYDTSVIHQEEIWFFKEEMINPYKSVGFAIKEKMGKKLDKVFPLSFGIRPLSLNNNNQKPENLDERMFKQIINSALQQKPVPISQIRNQIALQGPFLRTNNSNAGLFKQKGVDDILRVKVDKLISKKYSHLKRIYG